MQYSYDLTNSQQYEFRIADRARSYLRVRGTPTWEQFRCK